MHTASRLFDGLQQPPASHLCCRCLRLALLVRLRRRLLLQWLWQLRAEAHFEVQHAELLVLSNHWVASFVQNTKRAAVLAQHAHALPGARALGRSRLGHKRVESLFGDGDASNIVRLGQPVPGGGLEWFIGMHTCCTHFGVRVRAWSTCPSL